MDHEYFQTNPDSSGKNVRQSTIFEASIPQEADQIVVLEGLDEEDIEMNYSVEVHNICHNCHTFENEVIIILPPHIMHILLDHILMLKPAI